MKRTLLAAALTLTSSAAFAAGLTGDEVKFQRAMAEGDPEAYAEAVKFCDRDAKKTEEQRVQCWRERLAFLAKKYADEEKTVKPQDPTNSWTKLELALIRQLEGATKKEEDRTPEEKEYAQLRRDMDAWVKDPDNKTLNKEGAYVAAFRDPLQKMMKSYSDNAAGFSLSKHSAQVIKASKDQAAQARVNPSGQFDGKIPQNAQLNADGVPAGGVDPAKRKQALSQITGDSTQPRPEDSPPPPAPLTPEKVAGAPDKNKWNNEIAGLKGGIWAGMIALILGGPVGALVFGAIGFGAFTAISAHNNQ
jgi:hypothetical protein